jgi:hypothetical protein
MKHERLLVRDRRQDGIFLDWTNDTQVGGNGIFDSGEGGIAVGGFTSTGNHGHAQPDRRHRHSEGIFIQGLANVVTQNLVQHHAHALCTVRQERG